MGERHALRDPAWQHDEACREHREAEARLRVDREHDDGPEHHAERDSEHGDREAEVALP